MKRLGALLAATGIVGVALAAAPQPLPVVVPRPVSITSRLAGKSKDEIRTMRSDAATITPAQTFTDPVYGQLIEIQKVERITGGIQIFARAWKGGKQFGFGSDGTVDIERFPIFNPPLLVPDPTGTDLVQTTVRDNGRVITRKFREDPAEAVRQVLAHTIHVSAKDGSKIIPGKVGHTTATFFTDASAVDGHIQKNTSAVWATTHDAATGDVVSAAATECNARARRVGGAATNYDIERCIAGWLTSSIGGGSPVSSATASMWVAGSDFPCDTAETYVSIVSATPASNTSLATSDYSQFGTTKFATDKFLNVLTTSAYADFTLNASGIANINVSGNSNFGFRLGYDIDNSTVGDSCSDNFTASMSETAGTSQDPKLVVTYSAAAATSKPRAIIF